jgi:DNA-binding NarL/FixJ family response regulator
LGDTMRWSTKSMLIVDQEDDVVESLRRALHSTDYVIFQARTANEAFGVLTRMKHPIDFAIIDLDQAGEEGCLFSLIAVLGVHRRATKLIVKTSRRDAPFLEQVHYCDIDAIILKPISEEQLVERVRKALNVCCDGPVRTSAGSAA